MAYIYIYTHTHTHIHKLSSFRAEFQEDNLEDILIDKIIIIFFFSSNVLSILKLTSDSITRILKNNPWQESSHEKYINSSSEFRE